ncbi:M14 family zinc carboxypeptidase [Isosphaeraceae bacterium EP7]
MRIRCLALAASLGWSALNAAAQAPPAPDRPGAGLAFIDTGFENASPLWYESAPDGTILVQLLYDHERDSPNRAAGHLHFRVEAATGSKLTFEFRNLENVWNGRRASVAGELKLVVVSEDGLNWKPVPLERVDDARVRLTVTMPGPRLDVARVEPYRLSDLDKWLGTIAGNPLVQVTQIGKTVEGRGLEIVRIGRDDAPRRVFLRARAHPWEAGTNWVAQGLVDRLLKDDAESRRFLDHYCVYLMPMANKDGVARGRTRFNLRGKDLNRNWDRPADPALSPENHALERWLESMIEQGKRPHLALELHNDGNGQLHLSRPPIPDLDRSLARMKTFESLLRKHTWFTEGTTAETFRNAGTLGEGWLARYGIDAAVHEFNVNRIAGLDDYPSARHWKLYGEQLAVVFDRYFEAIELNGATRISP